MNFTGHFVKGAQGVWGERFTVTEKSKRRKGWKFLTTSAQVAVLLAVCVLASDHLACPAYAEAAKATPPIVPKAQSNTTRAIPTATSPADLWRSQA